jgi:hypothetical protein
MVAAALLFACGSPDRWALAGTPASPSADGIAQIERVEGDHRLVTVVLSNLDPPRRLGGALGAYVVWFDGGSAGVHNAGALEYDEARREGRMLATTPLTRFTLKITAELNEDVRSPGEVVIVTQRLGR